MLYITNVLKQLMIVMLMNNIQKNGIKAIGIGSAFTAAACVTASPLLLAAGGAAYLLYASRVFTEALGGLVNKDDTKPSAKTLAPELN